MSQLSSPSSLPERSNMKSRLSSPKTPGSTPTDSTPSGELSPATISEIIQMALSDEIGFEHIALQHGLTPDAVKELMRANLKPGSYKAWRRRVRRMRDQRAVYK